MPARGWGKVVVSIIPQHDSGDARARVGQGETGVVGGGQARRYQCAGGARPTKPTAPASGREIPVRGWGEERRRMID